MFYTFTIVNTLPLGNIFNFRFDSRYVVHGYKRFVAA